MLMLLMFHNTRNSPNPIRHLNYRYVNKQQKKKTLSKSEKTNLQHSIPFHSTKL